jgi:hypothetical protein
VTQLWYCPNCDAQARTVDAKLPMHQCSGIKGLVSPLVLVGTKAKVETREREDYVGKELVQTDAEGNVVMSTVTTRDDGQDCTIYVGTATVSTEVHGE